MRHTLSPPPMEAPMQLLMIVHTLLPLLGTTAD
jgi:hypothetical protein